MIAQANALFFQLGHLRPFEGQIIHQPLLAKDEADTGKSPSHWLVMAGQATQTAQLTLNPNWKAVPPQPGVPVWTDQFCDILSLFRTD